ncbi:hypothetical protein K2X14_14080 [Acetobacter sp. TBRC 12305]|uniref:HNH endonuclease n=1 Tax=Acetobacter garciniae TaxID=2817435 RepID=A0A939KPD2_9PROT|nr:hypothetical protein [Acetobacter garciniae]MBO1326740.1 hypothetical protein [Acetobacter garciniae]MBX0345962.1 hypothetical protein [Acetobacter garciniae]
MIPLCVPKGQESVALRCGATWSSAEGCHVVEALPLIMEPTSPLLGFLPYRFRPDRAPPYVRPWMVPQPLWGWNLRALLAKADWDTVRRWAYRRAGYRCRICGQRGSDYPVEADEGWAYDDARCVQTLKGVVALCPRCHEVRHWGRTMATGREGPALEWMVFINGWSTEDAQNCAQAALQEWSLRSARSWTCDISWVEQTFGLPILPDARERAAARQKNLVGLARQTYYGKP